MAIPTLTPALATISDSSGRDHPRHHVGLGTGIDEIASSEENLAYVRMEAEPEAGEASTPKKVKKDGTGVETILKQTAEIEMVLVGMAALRGGAPPTPVECHLAVKAYANLAGLVEHVAPHDLVSKKFLQSLIQQFTVSQQPTLPPISTPVSAEDGSTSIATPKSAKAASSSGKRPRVAGKAAKTKAAAKLGVSTNSITRSKDPQTVLIAGTSERAEKGRKSFLRGRGKIAQPDSDCWSSELHQQIALEIQLSKPDVLMVPLSETAGAHINFPFRCYTCKLLINDTSSVLICDGCEVGFHLLCLQMNKHSDIPEKDWYCTKCAAMCGGQPRQSIYGPLRRGTGRHCSRTTWILKSASEHPSAKASEYRLKLRNTNAAQDGKDLGAAKASSVVHTSKDTHVESSSRH